MTVYSLSGHTPRIDETAWVAEESTIIGQVTVAEGVSIWPGAVIRGDNDRIKIGARSNVQEGAVLHTDRGYVLEIAEDVTVGHQAMLHGCSIGPGSLVGIQAVILNGAQIGRECLIGAGALVTSNTIIPDRSLVLGSPAKVVRTIGDADVERLKASSASYVERSQLYRDGLKRVDV